MTTYYSHCETPLCPLLLLSSGEALTGLYLLPDHRHAPALQPDWQNAPNLPLFLEAARQLEAYFAKERQSFDLPLQAKGTPFQQRVWQELQCIGYGQTTTYGALAARLGNPNASRAVGLANGRNPLSIVVPCHRVVGGDGRLTGYGGGIARKQALLELESEGMAAAALVALAPVDASLHGGDLTRAL